MSIISARYATLNYPKLTKAYLEAFQDLVYFKSYTDIFEVLDFLDTYTLPIPLYYRPSSIRLRLFKAYVQQENLAFNSTLYKVVGSNFTIYSKRMALSVSGKEFILYRTYSVKKKISYQKAFSSVFLTTLPTAKTSYLPLNKWKKTKESGSGVYYLKAQGQLVVAVKIKQDPRFHVTPRDFKVSSLLWKTL